MKVLCFDPSGNWTEGDGTTGLALFNKGELVVYGDIKAKDFDCAESYWHEHVRRIIDFAPDVVVYETYRLQAGKARQQSWSQMETPQLIGVIKHHCWKNQIPCIGQNPDIKERFNDSILERMGIIQRRGKSYYIHATRTNDHMRDAIRHGLYYLRFGKGRV